MFSACKDVKFLEQLTQAGFGSSHFIMFADDPLFYNDTGDEGIYSMFRRDNVIKGEIRKPTGSKDQLLRIDGEYHIRWQPIMGRLKYFVIEVSSVQEDSVV